MPTPRHVAVIRLIWRSISLIEMWALLNFYRLYVLNLKARLKLEHKSYVPLQIDLNNSVPSPSSGTSTEDFLSLVKTQIASRSFSSPSSRSHQTPLFSQYIILNEPFLLQADCPSRDRHEVSSSSVPSLLPESNLDSAPVPPCRPAQLT